jgi:hypothetical protein
MNGGLSRDRRRTEVSSELASSKQRASFAWVEFSRVGRDPYCSIVMMFTIITVTVSAIETERSMKGGR